MDLSQKQENLLQEDTQECDIRQHLISRGLDLDKVNVILDVEKCIAVFLIYNLTGILCGYQQYNPAGDKKLRVQSEDVKDECRYYTFAGIEGDTKSKASKRLLVWGLDSLKLQNNIVFITEGIFDANRLHNIGLPALALLSNDPKHLKSFLMSLGRRIIAICDNDAPGQKLKNVADVSYFVPDQFHDLGEMNDEAVLSFINEYNMI